MYVLFGVSWAQDLYCSSKSNLKKLQPHYDKTKKKRIKFVCVIGIECSMASKIIVLMEYTIFEWLNKIKFIKQDNKCINISAYHFAIIWNVGYCLFVNTTSYTCSWAAYKWSILSSFFMRTCTTVFDFDKRFSQTNRDRTASTLIDVNDD